MELRKKLAIVPFCFFLVTATAYANKSVFIISTHNWPSVAQAYSIEGDQVVYQGATSCDGGQLTGFWLDDTPFSIDLYDPETYSHITLIPEPTSLLLLALGTLISRNHLRKTLSFNAVA